MQTKAMTDEELRKAGEYARNLKKEMVKPTAKESGRFVFVKGKHPIVLNTDEDAESDMPTSW